MENFGFNITCEEVIERAISIDIIEGKKSLLLWNNIL